MRRKLKASVKMTNSGLLSLCMIIFLMFCSKPGFSQSTKATGSFWAEGGVIITVILILIPILAGIWLMMVKVNNIFRQYQDKQRLQEAAELARWIDQADSQDLQDLLSKRKRRSIIL
ncbi:hypothetical protein [Pedobacter steynii]